MKKRYRVDDERIAVRGFSMGGAATWHFAVHYPTQWVAANPGAGFAETPEFLKVFQNETVEPTEIQKKLWHLYDCNDWAVNIFNLPTVAYSGEIDPQKQAADVMAAALDAEGITLRHVIGPGTKHQYHPEAKKTVEGLMASIVEAGRARYLPELRFTTYTLRYNQCGWVTVDGLWEHWKAARIEGNFPNITTDNVERMTLEVPAGHSPDLIPDLLAPVQLTIDTQQASNARRGRFRIAHGRAGCGWSTALGNWSRSRTTSCASGTACKGRSTTRSWIRSCSCGRRVRANSRWWTAG